MRKPYSFTRHTPKSGGAPSPRIGLGHFDSWPDRLRAVYDLVRRMQGPACLFWGADAAMLYNGAWAQALGSRHPEFFGATARSVSPELARACEAALRDAAEGRTPALATELLPVSVSARQLGGAMAGVCCTPLVDDAGHAEALLVQMAPSPRPVTLVAPQPAATDSDNGPGRIGFLLHLCDALRAADGPDEILAVGERMLRDALSADSVDIDEADAAGHARPAPRGRAAAEFDLARPSVPGPEGPRPTVPPLRSGQPLLTDVPVDPAGRAGGAAAADPGDGGMFPPVRAQLTVPILRGDTHVASVTVRHRQPHRWSAQEILTTREAGLRIWQAVEGARVEARRQVRQTRLARSLETEGLAVMFLSRDGTLTDANDIFLSLTGLRRPELAGGGLHWRDIVPPDRIAESGTLLAQLGESGRIDPREVELLREDGGRASVMLTGRDVGDGTTVAFAIDISDRKRMEDQLKQANRRLKVAQEAAGVGTFDWLIGTREIAWSPELVHMLGLREGALGGPYEDWVALIHPEDLGDATRSIEAALETGFLEGQWRIVRPDGSIIWVLVRGTVEHDEQKRPTRLTGAQVDITDRVRAEQDLRFLVTEFDRQLEELRRQLRNGGG